MYNTRRLFTVSLSLAVGLMLAVNPLIAQFDNNLDVPYVPTPPEVVEAMLKLAGVKKTDTVIDLGCGDGRIVVAAAQKFGARAMGFDLDPQRIREATENAKQAGVGDRAKFFEKNLFEVDVSEANVVTLYLLQTVNEKLKPTLQKQLKPGSRVVSHTFTMGDWKPDKEIEISGRRLYLWVIK
jgi:cyclopropane fatty-acyl-phospholipid synthase-like methyltransferase